MFLNPLYYFNKKNDKILEGESNLEHYSLKISQDFIPLIKNFYRSQLISLENDYQALKIKKDKITITVYNSGSVVISGRDLLETIIEVETICKINNNPAIGSDEAGTGDIFGPITVCACYLDTKNISDMRNSKITDSKKLDDLKIKEIAEKFIPEVKYALLVLDNKKFNAIAKKHNLNAIKALLHNQAILKLKEKINDVSDTIPVILDQFCEKDKYFSYLEQEQKVYKNIDFRTKAETYHKSVAMASFIARYIFVERLSEAGKKIGIVLPKGANNDVKKLAAELKKNLSPEQYLTILKDNYRIDI